MSGPSEPDDADRMTPPDGRGPARDGSAGAPSGAPPASSVAAPSVDDAASAPTVPLFASRGRRVRIAVLVLLAIVVAAFLVRPLVVFSPATTPAPPPVARGDRIALIAPDGSLSIVDREGEHVRRFPVEATAFRFPTFSPDGSLLAAVGGAVGRSGVFVFDVRDDRRAGPTLAPMAVFSSEDRGVIYLSWSPDGGRITFLTGEPGTLALRIVDADGSAPDEIVHRGQPLYWDWLADDRLFVHSGGAGPGGFVGEVGLDGVPIGDPAPAPGIFQSPGISRDARFAAYVALRGGGGAELVIEDRDVPDGRVALGVDRAASLGWSPSADVLAYIDGGGAAGPSLGPLRVVDAASGEVRPLLDAAVAAFFWSPDGRSIAALTLTARDGGNVAAAAMAGGPLAVIPGFDVHLVVVDGRTGERRLDRVVALNELFEGQLLPFFDQYAKSHRLWSADSSAIVLPLVDAEGRPHLTVISVDGRRDVDIGEGVLGFWSP